MRLETKVNVALSIAAFCAATIILPLATRRFNTAIAATRVALCTVTGCECPYQVRDFLGVRYDREGRKKSLVHPFSWYTYPNSMWECCRFQLEYALAEVLEDMADQDRRRRVQALGKSQWWPGEEEMKKQPQCTTPEEMRMMRECAKPGDGELAGAK
ncbi:uncharacterized protein J3D65DRAFT_614700 [Phyllosticta citribraziliensis]|uniref:Uncharacterized protein n=1 Tax=Phyllosticta citribraziliensis TaxID=989973 RepID=A0ABR1M542_9PEZI